MRAEPPSEDDVGAVCDAMLATLPASPSPSTSLAEFTQGGEQSSGATSTVASDQSGNTANSGNAAEQPGSAAQQSSADGTVAGDIAAPTSASPAQTPAAGGTPSSPDGSAVPSRHVRSGVVGEKLFLDPTDVFEMALTLNNNAAQHPASGEAEAAVGTAPYDLTKFKMFDRSAVWAPMQLESEIMMGSWFVATGEPADLRAFALAQLMDARTDVNQEKVLWNGAAGSTIGDAIDAETGGAAATEAAQSVYFPTPPACYAARGAAMWGAALYAMDAGPAVDAAAGMAAAALEPEHRHKRA